MADRAPAYLCSLQQKMFAFWKKLHGRLTGKIQQYEKTSSIIISLQCGNLAELRCCGFLMWRDSALLLIRQSGSGQFLWANENHWRCRHCGNNIFNKLQIMKNVFLLFCHLMPLASRCHWLLLWKQFNFIYIAPNHNKSHLMALYI